MNNLVDWDQARKLVPSNLIVVIKLLGDSCTTPSVPLTAAEFVFSSDNLRGLIN